MSGGVFGVISATVVFSITDWDVRFQNLFYLEEGQRWIWDRQEPVSKLLLYDGFNTVVVTLALSLLAFVLIRALIVRTPPWRSRLTAALLVIFLTPMTAGILKSTTNVPCPRDVVEFGGQLPNVDVLHTWPDGQAKPAHKQRCFPAGHASTAFGLLGLTLLVSRGQAKAAIAAAAMLAGWLTGSYKMAIGDHFVSHTLISMSIAIFWLGVATRVNSRADY